jgi:hypothetical protein
MHGPEHSEIFSVSTSSQWWCRVSAYDFFAEAGSKWRNQVRTASTTLHDEVGKSGRWNAIISTKKSMEGSRRKLASCCMKRAGCGLSDFAHFNYGTAGDWLCVSVFRAPCRDLRKRFQKVW